MLQKFEGGKGYSPAVTIRANGDIGLNRGVVIRYCQPEINVAELYYDESNEVIAILPVVANGNTDELLTSGAIKVRSDGANAGVTLPAKAFCDRFGIDYSHKRVVKTDGIKLDDGTYEMDGLILVALAHEVRRE